MVGFALEVHRSCAKHPWGAQSRTNQENKEARSCERASPPGYPPQSEDVTLFPMLGYVEPLALDLRVGPQAACGLHGKADDGRRDDRQDQGNAHREELLLPERPARHEV